MQKPCCAEARDARSDNGNPPLLTIHVRGLPMHCPGSADEEESGLAGLAILAALACHGETLRVCYPLTGHTQICNEKGMHVYASTLPTSANLCTSSECLRNYMLHL